jgi:hypothetical protein
MVFDLSSKGYNQHRISAILHVSQALVSLDLAQLRKDAANSMKSYLEEKLPLIYQECYEGISQVISRSWEMINDVNTPTQTRVQLLALVADATQTKLDISCGGEVIENGIKYAQQNINNRFVAIAKPEEILHYSNVDNNNGEEVRSKGNDDNNSLTGSNYSNDNNIVGNDGGSNSNDVTGSSGIEEDHNDDVTTTDDNDSNVDNEEVAATKEEDYTTDPFTSSYSSSFSTSSSSQSSNTNTNNKDNNNSSNRRTKNSVF